MIPTRQMHVEMEVVKWVLLAIAAAALASVFATAVAAAPGGTTPPALFPLDAQRLAQPMPQPEPSLPDAPPAAATDGATDMRTTLWQAVTLQRDGHAAEALAQWDEVALPPQRAHWRRLAMGVAEMRLGRMAAAQAHLQAARDLAPRHAVVDYFMGLLRLEQAAAATLPENELPEGGLAVQLVSLANQPLPPTRAMYELAAMMELRAAIKHAPEVARDEALLPGQTGATAGPWSGDLIAALGADNVAGKAHYRLGDLYLRRGMLTDAEESLDAAAATGIPIPVGYEKVGLLRQQQGQNGDAVRLYWKQLNQKCAPWMPVAETWLGIGREIRDGFVW